ncbi:MAG: Na+/H+ antiporter NhaC family protein [Mogibacterium sp.]|nr:Na+/H+ antiporter NhaC family protein [Mogibacterium sp.]
MNRFNGKRLAYVLGLAGLMVMALPLIVLAEEEAGGPALYGTAWSLLPPVLAIVLALITKEAFSSLFIGVVVGAILAANGSLKGMMDNIVSGDHGMVAAVAENAGLWIFLVILGIIVALVNQSGGSAAFGRWAETHIKTRVGAQLATFVLGILIFIDDYFNCLTVGSVMMPVTDTHRISRAKLSYLIDATAAPICMIAPVSSWAAAVSSTAEDLGTGISGIELFIRAIPYNFYSLLTLVFIVAIVLMKFDYGPMKGYEDKALQSGDLGVQAASADQEAPNPRGKLIDLVIPIVVLIITCTVGMLYVGGFFGTDWWGDTGNGGNFIGAFGNTDAFVGLPWGAIVALAFTLIYLVVRRNMTFKEAMGCLPKGFGAMTPAMIILTLAVSLKNMTGLLGAADFVHGVMENASDGLYRMLPAVIFLVAVFLAFASGTSWGTFGVLIPIVCAVFPADSTLMYIGISACLAGAVCGDHCSPISDTTIMASAGAQIEHINHVSSQLPYAMTVAAISFATYIAAGFIQNAVISLLIGIALTVGTLFVMRSRSAKAAA